MQTTANADGSAITHVVMQCTLQELSKATGLRAEDAAFALAECGLLRHRTIRKMDTRADDEPPEEEEYTTVTREMVETVAKERNVKRMCMDLKHVLL
ncbi:uncharacterized protein PHACADRAFT_246603 [Phanerochaete carnosa HHB-10118-sp]|uniref:Uncharacterized protein n=1 Tax=Phanerochaete carnosa (strain HHB-10118-sp) TaxID=650164 RepID=K5W9E6_PHACS|nr:uncharacterized protein PHACADRAFT_246603 [Phanerochaete carnosa HHB-10118-sp]EKM60583.1 hypothetical protein PHACADRAFT_246603 [Phanerochaete carnosa HHB-10118-sp]